MCKCLDNVLLQKVLYVLSYFVIVPDSAARRRGKYAVLKNVQETNAEIKCAGFKVEKQQK